MRLLFNIPIQLIKIQFKQIKKNVISYTVGDEALEATVSQLSLGPCIGHQSITWRQTFTLTPTGSLESPINLTAHLGTVGGSQIVKYLKSYYTNVIIVQHLLFH